MTRWQIVLRFHVTITKFWRNIIKLLVFCFIKALANVTECPILIFTNTILTVSLFCTEKYKIEVDNAVEACKGCILTEGLYVKVRTAKQLVLDLLTGRIYLFIKITFLLAIQPMQHALRKKSKFLIGKLGSESVRKAWGECQIWIYHL